jgi:PAS domain-containing protein
MNASEQAEEALRLSEQRNRSLVEATAAIVWSLPPSGVADSSPQPSWSAFTGQTPEQYTGWGWLDALHPDDRDAMVRNCGMKLGEDRFLESKSTMIGRKPHTHDFPFHPLWRLIGYCVAVGDDQTRGLADTSGGNRCIGLQQPA